jgi:hypothetical protein
MSTGPDVGSGAPLGIAGERPAGQRKRTRSVGQNVPPCSCDARAVVQEVKGLEVYLLAAAPIITIAPTIARLAPSKSVTVGRCPSTIQSHAKDAAMYTPPYAA